MLRKTFNHSKLIMFGMIIMLLIGGAGCKSKKKMAALSDAEAEKAKIEQEQQAMAKQKLEEEARKVEAARLADEKARKEAEKKAKMNAPENKLNNYFNAIANAGSAASANGSITEALSMFASPETPVLIVISQENGQKDYEKPTTIKAYLNYLKDTKKSMATVGQIETDASGKINSLELIK